MFVNSISGLVERILHGGLVVGFRPSASATVSLQEEGEVIAKSKTRREKGSGRPN